MWGGNIKFMKEVGQFLSELAKAEAVQAVAGKGWCREWCLRMANLVDELTQEDMVLEIREVEVEPELWHSFLKILISEESWFYDGVGVGNHESYLGTENQAPDHLKNSRIDALLMGVRNRKS